MYLTSSVRRSLQSAFVFAVGLLWSPTYQKGRCPPSRSRLSMDVRALANRGALVCCLSAVETLGCTDATCKDKTGALTRNRMTLVALLEPRSNAACCSRARGKQTRENCDSTVTERQTNVTAPLTLSLTLWMKADCG